MLFLHRANQRRIYSQQGPVQKKVGALQLGRQTLFLLEKKLATFFSYHRPCVSCQLCSKTGDLFLLITLVSLGGRPFFRHAKFAAPFVGALFVGPVRPNMLNMPKSAAGAKPLLCPRQRSAQINASIIQGSAIGPALYVLEAADLRHLPPVKPRFQFRQQSYWVRSYRGVV